MVPVDLEPTALLAARLRLLASEVIRAQTVDGWVPDVADAIEVATELLVANLDTAATVDVALLSPRSSFAESRDLVCEMLMEQGIDPNVFSTSDIYGAQLDAFVAGLLDADAIEGPFYDQVSSWDAQSPLDQDLAQLFNERDGLADPTARAAVEARMREAVRNARAR